MPEPAIGPDPGSPPRERDGDPAVGPTRWADPPPRLFDPNAPLVAVAELDAGLFQSAC